ncbi:MAG: Crp/Fnr family transcriptional regulator [Planctomycetaceae bacterium]
MEASQLKAILEDHSFTAHFPQSVLEALAEVASVQEVTAGEIVFRDGGPNDQLYLVQQGRLALEINIPGQRPVRILTLAPGEMAGWSALLGEGKMTAGATAIVDSVLIVAPAAALRDLCEVNHDFGYHLMRQMAVALSQRLVVTRLQLLDLFGNSPAPLSIEEKP